MWPSAPVPTHAERPACPPMEGRAAWLIVEALGACVGHSHGAAAPLQACSHLLVLSTHPPLLQTRLRVSKPTVPPTSTLTPKWGAGAPALSSTLTFLSCFLSSSRNQKGVLICIPVWTLEPRALSVTSVVRPLDFGPGSTP